jgi:regulator of sirC expression with transglutaminase-like and TPR domain
MAEDAADPRGERTVMPFLATHPTSAEREATLRDLAGETPGSARRGEAEHQAALSRVMPLLLADEVRQRRPERSMSVLDRLISVRPADPVLHAAKGEVLRLRNGQGDDEAALAAFRMATRFPAPPPTAWRGIGLIERARGQDAAARVAFTRYLAATPEPPDAAMIRRYLVETR